SGAHATWNISRSGGAYTVTRDPDYGVDPTYNNGGQYTVGNTILIKGTSLGGSTPANDLTITVTSGLEFNNARMGACADLSQRFIKFTDSTGQFSEVIDQNTLKPHSSMVIGDVGGHT